MAAFFGRTHSVACVVLAAGIAAAALGVPEPAHGQGLFDVLRGIFGGGPPRPRSGPPLLLEGFPGEEPEIPDEAAGPYVSYCVRLCDGRYFPLPANAGAQSPQQMCSALCPAAKTQVFAGSGIERAAATDGKPYTSLPNAFVYRDRMVNDCTCTGAAATGVAHVDIASDPTLRPGDIVVTENGPKVFRGGRPPHQASDFVPAAQDRRLPPRLRESLSDMRIAAPRERAKVPREPAAADRKPALGFLPENDSTMKGFDPQN